MMTLKSNGEKLAFTALGDWGREGSAQRDVAKQLGDWSEAHNSAFTAGIGTYSDSLRLVLRKLKMVCLV